MNNRDLTALNERRTNPLRMIDDTASATRSQEAKSAALKSHPSRWPRPDRDDNAAQQLDYSARKARRLGSKLPDETHSS